MGGEHAPGMSVAGRAAKLDAAGKAAQQTQAKSKACQRQKDILDKGFLLYHHVV
jgi:hypothetical protein